jgi:hypothetical protein
MARRNSGATRALAGLPSVMTRAPGSPDSDDCSAGQAAAARCGRTVAVMLILAAITVLLAAAAVPTATPMGAASSFAVGVLVLVGLLGLSALISTVAFAAVCIAWACALAVTALLTWTCARY